MKAYKDASDGYYQYDGEDTPAWAAGMTLTEVIVLVVIPPTYQELRAAEYNLKSTGEQFAMQYDDQVNGTTAWIDWQQGIKDRIPK